MVAHDTIEINKNRQPAWLAIVQSAGVWLTPGAAHAKTHYIHHLDPRYNRALFFSWWEPPSIGSFGRQRACKNLVHVLMLDTFSGLSFHALGAQSVGDRYQWNGGIWLSLHRPPSP
jgi:hypothetical protein